MIDVDSILVFSGRFRQEMKTTVCRMLLLTSPILEEKGKNYRFLSKVSLHISEKMFPFLVTFLIHFDYSLTFPEVLDIRRNSFVLVFVFVFVFVSVSVSTMQRICN
jgi:hypothetical protein